MIGIYKITSPKGRIYIGQSIDIELRFTYYTKLRCKKQPKLYKSLLKYGHENHLFEIMIECGVSELNDLERYYQDLFNSVEEGLNCFYTKSTDRNGYMCIETRKKMSISRIGDKNPMYNVKRSEEYKLKYSIGSSNPMFGKKHSYETIEKIRLANKGKKGNNWNEKQKLEQSLKIKGIRYSKEINMKKGRGGSLNHSAKKVICIKSGEIWDCIKDCAKDISINYVTLVGYLNGYNPNKTSIKYL